MISLKQQLNDVIEKNAAWKEYASKLENEKADAAAAKAEADLTKQLLDDAIEKNTGWQSYHDTTLRTKEAEFNRTLAAAESQLQTKELEISSLRIQLSMLKSPAAFATKK